MSRREPIGNKNAILRRPPANPKYENVRPVVDTGMTVELARLIKQLNFTAQRRVGEAFLRVPCRVLADYIQRGRRAAGASQREEDGGFAHPMDEYRPPDAGPECLLLDCRTEEEFAACHIEGALHYPKRRLAHAMNPFLPEMLAAKNKSDKLIIVYDLEGELTLGQNVGMILFEKGIDNLAVLDGGLREFVQDYASLIVGESPVPIVPRDNSLRKRAEAASAARGDTDRSFFTHKPKSLSNSLAKPLKR